MVSIARRRLYAGCPILKDKDAGVIGGRGARQHQIIVWRLAKAVGARLQPKEAGQRQPTTIFEQHRFPTTPLFAHTSHVAIYFRDYCHVSRRVGKR